MLEAPEGSNYDALALKWGTMEWLGALESNDISATLGTAIYNFILSVSKIKLMISMS